MEITIFKEVTTEGVITSIEENSKKYHDGFYADMNNAPERKLVKESSADIKGIIKELEAKRIKINKDNTANTNKECKSIVDRLEAANAPFTSLEDDYKAERKIILDAEKADREAIILKAKIEDDHEFALLLNKTFECDREQELKEQAEIKKEMQRNAQEEAKAYQEAKTKEEAQRKINEENARLANKEYVRKINHDALFDLMTKCALDEDQAKSVVIMIARKEIQNVTINY